MRKLKAVDIDKRDTCLTYAFRRIGHKSKLTDLGDLEQAQEYELLDYFEHSSTLQVGDILIFTNKQEWVTIGTSITEDGKIISHDVLTHRHCVVYEGNGEISDLSRTGIKGLTLPSLRWRKFKEIKSKPTYIIRIENDKDFKKKKKLKKKNKINKKKGAS